MSKKSLVTLMRSRAVVHPSIVRSVEIISDRALIFKIEGFPWWLSDLGDIRFGKIKFTFEGVGEGLFDLNVLASAYDKMLEDFNITETDDLTWAQEYGFAIYCYEPVSKPLEIYSRVHDWIASSDCFYSPLEYLNFGNSTLMSGFEDICSSRSFLIALAPKALADLICEELENQNVRHNRLPQKIDSYQKLYVKIAGSRFFCEKAIYDIE